MTPDKETAIHKEVVKAKVQSILYVLSKQNKKFTRDFFFLNIYSLNWNGERKKNQQKKSKAHPLASWEH